MQRIISGRETFSVNLNDEDLDELDKLAEATKGQDPMIKKAGYTAILNDVLQRTDTAIDMQKESQAYIQTTTKFASGIVLVMALLLIANFALTISAIEMSKESHVKSSAMTDTGGKIVQVGSSDFTLGSGGEIVQRASASTAGSVGTAPVLSKYKLSSRTPNKYLEELDAFTVTRPCPKDAKNCNTSPTMKVIVKSFKRQPSEGSHCGSVVVFQTDMGEFTLDDDSLYHGESKVSAANGLFSLGDRRLANLNISVYGRRLMEEGAAPAVDASVHGAFNFLGNVKVDEFVCEMGGIIGKKFIVDPPKPPVVPYAFVVRKESTCVFDEDDACESALTQGLRPGVMQHANFTTMRSYEQVLLTHTHRVVVAYFASQPLSRLIQITHIESQVFTQYINFRTSTRQLNCIVKPIEGGKTSMEMAVHLAYLSTADDQGHPSMRWALSPYDGSGAISPNYNEYWERVGTRKPRRFFQHGNAVISQGVSVHFFMTPQEWVEFSPGMTDDEVAQWLTSVLSLKESDAINVATRCPDADEAPKGTMPPYLGPYGEAAARWIAPQLQEGDLEQFGPSIRWPMSYYKYWNAVVANLGTPSVAGSTVNEQSSGNGRRLETAEQAIANSPRRRRQPTQRSSQGNFASDPIRAADYNDEQANAKMAKANFPKSTYDMKEFANCFSTVKDCFQSRSRRLLERQNQGEFSSNVCRTMLQSAMGSIGSDQVDSGGASDFKIELQCGPCVIGISSSIPSFACIFEGGSGCFWKSTDSLVQLSIVGFIWEKWVETVDLNTDYSTCLKSEIIRADGGDWIDFVCPDFTRVLSGGCNAKQNPYKMQASRPFGNGWVCGGGGGNKEGRVICSGRVGSQVVSQDGDNWVSVYCPSGKVASGGGCEQKRRPFTFRYNAPVGTNGWRCGNRRRKTVFVVCVSSDTPITHKLLDNGYHWNTNGCGPGKMAIGGGCDAASNPWRMQASWPTDDGQSWQCGGHNDGTPKRNWVLCVPAYIMAGDEKCTCPQKMTFTVSTTDQALCADGPTSLEYVGVPCGSVGTRIKWTRVSAIMNKSTASYDGGWSPATLAVTGGAFVHTSGGGVFLSNGALQFNDRGYTFSNIPTELDGMPFFRGPCHSEVVTMVVTAATNTRVYVLASKGNYYIQPFASGLVQNGFTQTTIDLSNMGTGASSTAGFNGWEKDLATGQSVSIYTTRDREITIAYKAHPGDWVPDEPPNLPELVVAQGSFNYVVSNGTVLGHGARQFNDRQYTFDDIPEELVGAAYFRGPQHSQVVHLTLTSPFSITVYVLASMGNGNVNALASSLHGVGFVDSTIADLSLMKTGSSGTVGFYGWQKNLAAGASVSIITDSDREITIAFKPELQAGRRLSGAVADDVETVQEIIADEQQQTAQAEQSNCAWTEGSQTQQWKNKYLGRCGVAPSEIPSVPTDCDLCPSVIKYTTSSNKFFVCGHSSYQSRVEHTGVQCGGYLNTKILWDSFSNLDPRPGFTTSQCTWSRFGNGRRLSGAVADDADTVLEIIDYEDKVAAELLAEQEATIGSAQWRAAYLGGCGNRPKYFKKLPTTCGDLTTAVAVSRRLSGAVPGSEEEAAGWTRRRTPRRRTPDCISRRLSDDDTSQSEDQERRLSGAVPGSTEEAEGWTRRRTPRRRAPCGGGPGRRRRTPNPTPMPTPGWTTVDTFLQAHNGNYLEDNDGTIQTSANKGETKQWKQSNAGGGKIYLESYRTKELGEHNSFLVFLDNNANANEKKWKKVHAGWSKNKNKWYFKSHTGKYLSAPSGIYGCSICLTIDISAAGMKMRICVGFDSGCWIYLEILAQRVPPPQWAKMTGVTITLTGYIKICFEPLAVNGWVKLQVSKGFCVGAWWTFGMTVTYSIYGYLKFEMIWANNGEGVTLIGSAAIGVSGGVYAPSWTGRRRGNCSCGRVGADGKISSCPRRAGANGQLTFTLKMWPCQKGKDATLTGTISFAMSLDLFGIDISLPKIPDIQLFSTTIRKPFGG